MPTAGRVLWPVPDELASDAAVFVADILPRAIRAVESTACASGSTVAVTGAGMVGLLALMLAGLRSKVVVVFGAGRGPPVAPESGGSPVLPDGAAAIARESSGCLGADAVIEASGTTSALRSALEMVRGRRPCASWFNRDAPVDMRAMFAKDATLCSSTASPTDDPLRAANLVFEVRLDVRRIISDHLGLEETPYGYDLFSSWRAIKSMCC